MIFYKSMKKFFFQLIQYLKKVRRYHLIVTISVELPIYFDIFMHNCVQRSFISAACPRTRTGFFKKFPKFYRRSFNVVTQLIRRLHTFSKLTSMFVQFIQNILQKVASKFSWKSHEISIKMFQNCVRNIKKMFKDFFKTFSSTMFLNFFQRTLLKLLFIWRVHFGIFWKLLRSSSEFARFSVEISSNCFSFFYKNLIQTCIKYLKNSFKISP